MKHVVWDWNGTLFDDLHVVVDAVNAALGDSATPTVDARLYRTLYTRPVRLFYERLLRRPITDEEWWRLDELYHRTYAAGLEAGCLAPDARAALARVAERRGSQSLLSMWRHADLVGLVQRFGLLAWFERVDGVRGRGGDRKAEYLAAHLAELGLDGRETVLVGDALDDAVAAADVGAVCVLYDGGSHERSELEAAGVPVVSSLLEALDVVGL